MDGEYQYRCRCGATFEESLGKYGCPECEASEGAALLIQAEEEEE